MRTLIVGSGFVGRAVARHMVSQGDEVVLASRRRPAAASVVTDGERLTWRPLDATDRDACARLVDAVDPDAVLLVHGPSDVTWCQAHPHAAEQAHGGSAAGMAAAADGRRVVLISTDNVFDGSSPASPEDAPTAPANAYGRAKLHAERIVQDRCDDATVLRVSLVYGWEPENAGKWLNFFASCAYRLRRGHLVEAPSDHWTTPVAVDDTAAVTAAVLRGPAPALLHLGGPERLSRMEWAHMIADGVGASRDLVRPVPRSASRYACRPVNACLSSLWLHSLPATRGIRVRGAAEATQRLLIAAEHRSRTP